MWDREVSFTMTNPSEMCVPTLDQVAGKSLHGAGAKVAEEQYRYRLKCAIGLITRAITVSAGLSRLSRRAEELERELRALTKAHKGDLTKPS